MTAEMIALGRRAAACKGWRWMAGMRWEAPNHGTDGRLEDWEAPTWGAHRGEDDTAPDLTDPATLGCLLALVRDAHSLPALCTKLHDVLGWIVTCSGDPLKSVYGNTEAEALVAALEAAP